MARPRLRWGFQLAASGFVVLGSAFSGQATTRLDRELLTPANRKVRFLSRHSF